MWYRGRDATPIPAASALDELRGSQLAERRTDGVVYNPGDFSAALQAVADAWREAFPHLEAAARQLSEAETVADHTPVFYHFWWNGAQATPTRREHLRRQRLYVESMAFAGREIGLQFGLYALWEKSTGDEKAFRSQATTLLAEDAAACRAAEDFFHKLGKPKNWAEAYAAKARRIEAYLAAKS